MSEIAANMPQYVHNDHKTAIKIHIRESPVLIHLFLAIKK